MVFGIHNNLIVVIENVLLHFVFLKQYMYYLVQRIVMKWLVW